MAEVCLSILSPPDHDNCSLLPRLCRIDGAHAQAGGGTFWRTRHLWRQYPCAARTWRRVLNFDLISPSGSVCPAGHLCGIAYHITAVPDVVHTVAEDLEVAKLSKVRRGIYRLVRGGFPKVATAFEIIFRYLRISHVQKSKSRASTPDTLPAVLSLSSALANPPRSEPQCGPRRIRSSSSPLWLFCPRALAPLFFCPPSAGICPCPRGSAVQVQHAVLLLGCRLGQTKSPRTRRWTRGPQSWTPPCWTT